jgi:PmbA protein
MAKAEDSLNLLTDLIGKARAIGADAADALMFDARSLSLSRRLGKPEDLERSESHDLGLRVFIGKRQAFVSSTDTSKAALEQLVDRAVAMAKAAAEDKYCGLADSNLLAKQWPSLDIDDGSAPTAEELLDRAARAEDAAMAVKGVTNSEGGGAGWSWGQVALVTSGGFAGSYSGSRHDVSVSVVAGEGTGMERDYDYSSSRHVGDLEAADLVGRRAGERAVRRLGPRKASTAKVPVVYDPRVATSMLGHLAGAISGPSVARGTSFLRDKLGEMVFASGIEVIDDPHRKRGLSSKPFDGEGVANQRRAIVADGRLTTWLMDSASARQLGLATTGHAARGTGGPPGPAPTNFYLAAGKLDPKALMADIKQGLYVTELIGFGVNGVTGDYSRGAAGFWIENGALAYPVSEITIAGNLKDMFQALTPASDLEFRRGTDAPTIRIDGMTVAGA